MGADQQFCLRWNNFHTNITSAFESLRDDEDFVDITLACEGRQIKAHKMVLSACSPYFRSLLRGNPCQHPIVFLKDVSFANLSSILDFMYHGEVNVSHNELATFLKTAEALRVRGLAEDDNKRDGDSCTEPSSPPPPRDPPEPCSPGRPEDSERGGDPHSQLPDVQPFKRRRSGSIADDAGGGGGSSSSTSTTATSAAPISTEVLPDNVKNEPEDYINEEEDMLAQQQQQQQQQQQHLSSEDIKMDGFSSSTEDAGSDYLSGPGGGGGGGGGGSGGGELNRTNTTMHQIQDSYSPFIPGITVQSTAASSFLPHSASVSSAEHGRPHPSFSLEGVTGLPAGISTLPGPSLPPSGGGGQDSSGQGLEWLACGGRERMRKEGGYPCPHCPKVYTARCNLSRHIRDMHIASSPSLVVCPVCGKNCRNRSNALTHLYRTHHITSKQLRTEAGVLFSGTNSNALNSNTTSDNIDGDQEPPTFSFDHETTE